jgi:site-specific DNA-methyltransferase (cytosine-N4-specific)
MTEKSKYFSEDKGKYGVSGLLTGRSLTRFLESKGKNPGDIWEIAIKPFSCSHFAIYPEELCIRPIKSSCPPKGIVLDMFAGSGTTLVVAKKLGRRFIGCDLNLDYVKITRKRLKVL